MESTMIRNQVTSKTSSKFQWAALIVLMMAQIGTSGDNAILLVATSSFVDSLHATIGEVQLANTVYSLCAGSFVIIGGMLGIIIGWKRIFRIGAMLCALGELVVAISPTIEVLTWGGRLTIGLGASLMIPSVLGLIPTIYKGNERAIAFGAAGAAAGIGLCIGPILAGVLIDSLGWRFAFGCMAVYFILVVFASYVIPNSKRTAEKAKMDYVGASMTAAGLFFIIISISKCSSWGIIEPLDAPFTVFGISPSIPMCLFGAAILCLLVPVEKRIELKRGSALIPQSFLKTPQVRDGSMLQGMLFLILGGEGILINTYLQLVGGFNSTTTGLAVVSMAFPMIALSIGLPRYWPKASPKWICRSGIIIAALSTIILSMSLENNGVFVTLYIGLFMMGSGLGLVSSQASDIVATAVNPRDAQQSSGFQIAARDVGQAVGVAVLGMVLLFVLNGVMHQEIKQSNLIGEQTKDKIVELKNINFMSNQAFTEYVQPIAKNSQEVTALSQINEHARKRATQAGVLAMGIIVFLFLFGTRNIPEKK
ncbi:MFS transporter [Bacillus sp. 1P06AnD]|uniref:MFS transporter n=1 Tax=Bacillus sp. 1P06AnD TaxID=3132208 RepID=UPI0039A39A7D